MRMHHLLRWVLCIGTVPVLTQCAALRGGNHWKHAVDHQVRNLGYKNWIVIAEASFPAHSVNGIQQVAAPVEVPEAVDYVLRSLEKTENLRPTIYVPRELRSVENDFAPGIDQVREELKKALHGHEPTEIDQQSLLTVMEDANRNFTILVIRTGSALPYASVFMELQPGYWDSQSESRLRKRIQDERMQRLVRSVP